MNSYERYINTLKGQPVDYLPRVPILMQYAAEYIGSNYGDFASDYKVLVKANLQCAIDFGIDQLSCISDPYRETQGFGSQVTYVKDGPPHRIIELPESLLLGVGTLEGGSPSRGNYIRIIKSDLAGIILCEKEYATENEVYHYPTGIETSGDDNFIVAANCEGYGDIITKTWPWFLMTYMNGDTLWTQSLNQNPGIVKAELNAHTKVNNAHTTPSEISIV